MKTYFEIFELSDDIDNVPQRIGPIYVDDIYEAKLLMQDALVEFDGLNYKAQFVTCRHEEGLPCSAEEIKESDL